MYENELYHHGILGMKWGIRRYQPYGSGGYNPKNKGNDSRATRKKQRTAKKDAKRYADAKMFYGQGAGTRRKLLKAELDKKMKDPEYKKFFDEEYSKLDLSKSVSKAKRERTARDTVSTIEAAFGTTVAVAAVSYYIANKDTINRKVLSFLSKAKSAYSSKKNMRQAVDFLKRNGIKL